MYETKVKQIYPWNILRKDPPKKPLKIGNKIANKLMSGFTHRRDWAWISRMRVVGRSRRGAARRADGRRICGSCRASWRCRRGTRGRNIPRVAVPRPTAAAASGTAAVVRSATISPCRKATDRRRKSSGGRTRCRRLWCPNRPCRDHPRDSGGAAATGPAVRSTTSYPCSRCRSSAIKVAGEMIIEW